MKIKVVFEPVLYAMEHAYFIDDVLLCTLQRVKITFKIGDNIIELCALHSQIVADCPFERPANGVTPDS